VPISTAAEEPMPTFMGTAESRSMESRREKGYGFFLEEG